MPAIFAQRLQSYSAIIAGAALSYGVVTSLRGSEGEFYLRRACRARLWEPRRARHALRRLEAGQPKLRHMNNVDIF